MITALDFYKDLKKNIPYLNDEKLISEEVIKLADTQIEMLRKLFISWYEMMPEKELKKLIKDILKKPTVENGKVYEALIYAWLTQHNIQYVPQVHIDQTECFKSSTEGYDADGKIEVANIVFDVKQFGITIPHILTLKRKLQDKLPENYYLTISGGKNISSKDLQTSFLNNIDDLAKCIMEEKNKKYTDYIYHDKRYGLEFRAYDTRTSSVYTSISEFNPYEWAENNEFYFMNHASQFCVNLPYIIFCPYDKQLAIMFSSKDREIASIAFRALCRRVFMNLTKMEDQKISNFDGKARNNISIATAAKKISAIVFVDVSKEYNYKDCQMYVYQNPNADFKLSRYYIDTIFRQAGASIEDFQFDNY